MNQLRIAIMGCGRMGSEHARVATKLGARVCLLYDCDPSRSQSLADKYPASVALQAWESIDWRVIDAVFICTPPSCRGPVEMAAVNAGVPIFAEKPVGISAEQCLQLERALNATPVINSAGYMNRYRSSVLRVREFLKHSEPIGIACSWVGAPYRVAWWFESGHSGSLLPELLRNRKALIVTTPTVARLYGRLLNRLIKQHRMPARVLILACSENGKSLNLVSKICNAALECKLDRRGVIVALGGGICSDLVTMAASLIRRGIEHIRVPTTLIGQVDAAVGIKGAVNFGGKKSFLGAFYPPASVLIDPTLLKTLPIAHLRYGFAEVIKISVICDVELFNLVARHSAEFLRSGFQKPFEYSRRVVRLAARRMLEQLRPNLYEDQSYKRLVDMGHTFSPALEAASGYLLHHGEAVASARAVASNRAASYLLHHGEAVAIDLAISATIGAELGLMMDVERNLIISTILSAGLPIFSELVTEELCSKALRDARLHRGGAINLVIPAGIGDAVFLEHEDELSITALRSALNRLAQESKEIEEGEGVLRAHG